MKRAALWLILIVIGCTKGENMTLKITSPEFENNGIIPDKYTCNGMGVNPPLKIEGIPINAETLALIVDDPDAPMGAWDHWILWNIPAKIDEIREASVPEGALQGGNGWVRKDYGAPCPPNGTHRYFFKIYALDTKLELNTESNKKDVENAMEGHVIEKAELIGLFKKE